MVWLLWVFRLVVWCCCGSVWVDLVLCWWLVSALGLQVLCLDVGCWVGDSVVGTCCGFCCYGLCVWLFPDSGFVVAVCAVACVFGWWLIVWLLVCGWLFDVLYALSRFFCGLLCGFRLFCVGLVVCVYISAWWLFVFRFGL